jgi:5-methylcytosine-specific restriction enzyme subunit McrC
MKNIQYFTFQEHDGQSVDDGLSLSKLVESRVLNNDFNEENLKYLGIHNHIGLNTELRAYYYIGMRWIEWNDQSKEKGIIWVKPKHSKIPFEKLLCTCLNHPKVRDHMEDCYIVFPDEPLIPVPSEFNDYITPLLITDFIIRVQHIIKKGIKKDFVKVNQILNSKIKGKILINQSIKNHIKRNLISQMACSYILYTPDCIENRILKTALLQVQKYIYRFMNNRENIIDILHYNLAAFEEIEPVTVNKNDLNTIKHSVFYKEYKPALKLAIFILTNLGVSLDSNISLSDKTIPPFYINMPELFERYCEVLLRNKYPDTLAGYQYGEFSETTLGRSKQRPDFIIPSINTIADSKYKYWISDKNSLDDIRQLSGYARHNKALEKLKSGSDLPKLQFIYPQDDGEGMIDFEDDKKNLKLMEYNEIYEYPITIMR